jgi:CO/xanthine dehydrogenase Mo-binding subunit
MLVRIAEDRGPDDVVGRSVTRTDLREKVTGAATYCVDVSMPGMAHAKVVRSDRAHARIVAIDTSKALAAPGVVGVITAADLDGLYPRFGHIIADHCILAIDKVRYYGEPVALVVAETVHEAADAIALVEITYDDLPAVLDAEKALLPGASLVHEHSYQASGDDSFKLLTGSKHEVDTPVAHKPTNVAHSVHLEWGDVDSALAEAAVVVETETHFPMLYAYAMEPYNAVASSTDEGLTVVSTAQHPYMVRDDLARVFGLPLSRIRVSAPYLGGGYGSKSYTKVEPMAAVASWATGRPVKLVLDVEESIYTTRVDSARMTATTGLAADGTIVARVFDIVMDSGAYADNGPLVLAKAVNRCFGPYRVPNLRVQGRSVYTNTSPASSYRGFGAPQGSLAGEKKTDQAAERLGISAAEVRRRNLVDRDEAILPGKRGLDADIKADLEMVVASLERDAKDRPGYGIGFSCSASDAGAYPVSTAQVRIQIDGSVTVLSGSTEMGQGSQSVLGQIAAQELGVGLDQVSVVQSDTAVTPYERTTGASRTTTLVGLALQRACADARRRVREMLAELIGCPVDQVSDRPGGAAGPDERVVPFSDVVQRWFGASAGEVTGVGLVRRDGATAAMPPFWELGMGGVGLQVDPETGTIQVHQLVTVADVGFAINPAAVEAQDLGAATQGLGLALFEELVYDGAQLANANVVEYRVPRASDAPEKLDLMIVQRRDGVGPYGAKGAGEGALNPIGAAVAAAVAQATGRWPDRLPLTPERVWRLMSGPTPGGRDA